MVQDLVKMVLLPTTAVDGGEARDLAGIDLTVAQGGQLLGVVCHDFLGDGAKEMLRHFQFLPTISFCGLLFIFYVCYFNLHILLVLLLLP